MAFLKLCCAVMWLSNLAFVKADMPLPWKRELTVTNPLMTGNDVLTATILMSRCNCWPVNVDPSATYSQTIASAVQAFQKSYSSSLTATGVFDAETAQRVLDDFSYDGFVDGGKIKARDYGMMYKIYIPVFGDLYRDVETTAQLLDRDNNLLYSFTIRTHGSSDPPATEWPNYNNTPGYNQFTSNGNTMTGLGYLDLNSAEPKEEWKSFGSYPIHRIVSGIPYKNNLNNMAFLLQPQTTCMRSGILVHTGQWPDWEDGDQMPNSNGCMHIWPDDLVKINEILTTQYNIQIRKNPLSSVNYSYTPQGIISVEQLIS